jgi:hypothetical protein
MPIVFDPFSGDLTVQLLRKPPLNTNYFDPFKGTVEINKIKGTTLDPDAQAFLTAAGIISPTIINSINQLVIDLKNAGIWTKCLAIYPIVGGTAFSHKFNLKDPQDLDSSFRINFVGFWVHNNLGALPDGTTAYGNTFLTPSISLTQDNTHLSYYSNTNTTGNGIDIGCLNTNPNRFDIHLNFSGTCITDQYNFMTARITAPISDTLGFVISSRSASNILKLFKNGLQIGPTQNGASNPISNMSAPLFIGATNYIPLSPSAASESDRRCAYCSIGQGLTDTDCANYNTIVQTFETSLGR